MSNATKAVQADEVAQQGFPIDWSDDKIGANVSASDGGVTSYGRVSEDAAEDDVAADYLSAYDISGIDEAGEVTVTVWRLDEDGDRIAGTKATATRRHDARGRWL